MRLGPIVEATVIVRDLERSLAAYVGQLGLHLVERDQVPQQRALDMGETALIAAPRARLRSAAGAHAWLTLIEAPDAIASKAFERRGWLALELAVQDVDALAVRLDRQQFAVLGEPADLEFSAALRAMQVVGPDGEVLYLTEIKAAVPGMALIPARCPVDSLYIAVLACADRERTLGFYAGLGLLDQARMNARLSAYNRSHGLPDDQRHPIAIGQLRGAHAIEFDALPTLPAADSRLRSGIRLIGFARSDARGQRLSAQDDPSARILAGPEGEGIELL